MSLVVYPAIQPVANRICTIIKRRFEKKGLLSCKEIC